MVFLAVAGALLAAFSAWTLRHAILMTLHYRQNLRSMGIEEPRILPAQVIVIGGWSAGLIVGLTMVWLYFH